MAVFNNPNSPAQPQKGVYGWYAQQDGEKRIAIYIGRAGAKQTILPKGTLFRGISELQQNTFTSNSPRYDALDVDFIVGTAILFFERKSYSCFWEHLSNDPTEELEFVVEEQPLLQYQDNTRVKEVFRIRRNEFRYWRSRKNPEGVKEAEREVFAALERLNY